MGRLVAQGKRRSEPFSCDGWKERMDSPHDLHLRGLPLLNPTNAIDVHGKAGDVSMLVRNPLYCIFVASRNADADFLTIWKLVRNNPFDTQCVFPSLIRICSLGGRMVYVPFL